MKADIPINSLVGQVLDVRAGCIFFISDATTKAHNILPLKPHGTCADKSRRNASSCNFEP